MKRLAACGCESTDLLRSFAATVRAIFAGIAATHARAAMYTVGGAGCTFPTIQAALDAAAATIADDEIRITRSGEVGYYRDVAIVANDPALVQGSAGALRLVGGYDGVAPVTVRLGAAPRTDQPGAFTRNAARNGGVLALTDG